MKKLTIGLLECDHVRTEFRADHGDYIDMFTNLFGQVSSEVVIKPYDVINGVYPEDIRECDGFITTGSSFSVYDDEPWIHRLAAFVRTLAENHIPYVGVCFGHQMLAYALGGVVHKAPVGWCVGRHTFTVSTEKDWMNPFSKSFGLLMMCQDQVITPPQDTVTLASTPDCPNAIILVKEYMLGIQAHPEFTPAYDQALMELRIERIGEDKVNQGIRSLETGHDGVTIARWIINFFTNLQERN